MRARPVYPDDGFRRTPGAIISRAFVGPNSTGGDPKAETFALQGCAPIGAPTLRAPRQQPQFAQPEHDRGENEREKKIEYAEC